MILINYGHDVRVREAHERDRQTIYNSHHLGLAIFNHVIIQSTMVDESGHYASREKKKKKCQP